MQVADLIQTPGRVFLKSEGAPVADSWPCVAFTRRDACARLRDTFRTGHDVLLLVGTTDPAVTPERAHRSRLLSAVTIDTAHILDTETLVAAQVWASVRHGRTRRLGYALRVLDTAHMAGPPFPAARDILPLAYTALGRYANRGGIVEALGPERDAALQLGITPVRLAHTGPSPAPSPARGGRAGRALADTPLPQDIARMAARIAERVRRSGAEKQGRHPGRAAPEGAEMRVVLERLWQDQEGRCALCGGPLQPGTENPMLQASPDRIDSADTSYGADNLHITHLACNLAKNRYGETEFRAWLRVVAHRKDRMR